MGGNRLELIVVINVIACRKSILSQMLYLVVTHLISEPLSS